MRVVYLVNGSEDGIIGVYGSKAKAFAKAKEYAEVEQCEGTISDYIWFFEGTNHAHVTKECVE